MQLSDRIGRRMKLHDLHVLIALVQAGSMSKAAALHGELRERRIELGFARIDEPAPDEDVHQEVLFEDRLVVVAGMENPWVRRRRIRLAELVNEPWTWPSAGTMLDDLVVEAFRA